MGSGDTHIALTHCSHLRCAKVKVRLLELRYAPRRYGLRITTLVFTTVPSALCQKPHATTPTPHPRPKLLNEKED